MLVEKVVMLCDEVSASRSRDTVGEERDWGSCGGWEVVVAPRMLCDGALT